jgi:hypothetical protein
MGLWPAALSFWVDLRSWLALTATDPQEPLLRLVGGTLGHEPC